MGGLDFPQLTQQLVVLVVADQGRFENVVAVVVELDLASELFRSSLQIPMGHGCDYSPDPGRRTSLYLRGSAKPGADPGGRPGPEQAHPQSKP